MANEVFNTLERLDQLGQTATVELLASASGKPVNDVLDILIANRDHLEIKNDTYRLDHTAAQKKAFESGLAFYLGRTVVNYMAATRHQPLVMVAEDLVLSGNLVNNEGVANLTSSSYYYTKTVRELLEALGLKLRDEIRVSTGEWIEP
jgi:hypothetical protein